MHYPVDVFIGKIRDYDGSRPSAIAKVQIDGELMLTELGLQAISRPKRKSMAAPTARYAITPANTMLIGFASSPSRRRCFAPRRLARICRRTE